MDGDDERALGKISRSFQRLASALEESSTPTLDVASFSDACALVSPLFGCLGIAFKFAEMDYVAKVRDLARASGTISTLDVLVEKDIETNRVKEAGSHARNLLRVKRGIDMVKVLFEEILASEENSLKGPASKAYGQVFAPFHGWAIRKAVAAGLYALPTKAQLLKKLNEDESSARTHMQSYVTSCLPVVVYIDNLFLARQLGIDW